MKEYNISSISYRDFLKFDTIVIFGTNNKNSFFSLVNGLAEAGCNSKIVFVGRKEMFPDLEYISHLKCIFVKNEGAYSTKLIPVLLNHLKGESALLFFSPDPNDIKNDNILEIAAGCADGNTSIRLITMDTGDKKLYCYDNIIESYHKTDLYLKKAYYAERKKQYKFEDRSNSLRYLCIVLAGYKSELWEIIFSRLLKFGMKDIDYCIITSGKYIKEISEICANNGWSYLSTEENNVCLSQNLAIELHPYAQGIFKLDEDIFITRNFF